MGWPGGTVTSLMNWTRLPLVRPRRAPFPTILRAARLPASRPSPILILVPKGTVLTLPWPPTQSPTPIHGTILAGDTAPHSRVATGAQTSTSAADAPQIVVKTRATGRLDPTQGTVTAAAAAVGVAAGAVAVMAAGKAATQVPTVEPGVALVLGLLSAAMITTLAGRFTFPPRLRLRFGRALTALRLTAGWRASGCTRATSPLTSKVGRCFWH